MDKRNAIREDERIRIILSKFGNVGSQEIDYILEIMRECYDRLKPHEVALVDLYVFEQASSMDAFIAKESKEVGVVSTSFDELFFALHDAYRGTSRIILCIEKMKKLPKLSGAFNFTWQPILLYSPAFPSIIRHYKQFKDAQRVCN
jgi:hypothetical protein